MLLRSDIEPIGYDKSIEVEVDIGEFLRNNKEEIERLKKENNNGIIPIIIEYLKEDYNICVDVALKCIGRIFFFMLDFKYIEEDQRKDSFMIFNDMVEDLEFCFVDNALKEWFFENEDHLLDKAYLERYLYLSRCKQDICGIDIDNTIPEERDRNIYNLKNILDPKWRYKFLYENSGQRYKDHYKFLYEN